jgi:hypothetical protein
MYRQFENIEVTSRDEYREGQEPVCFIWRGEQHYVERVIDRWYEGGIDPTRMPMLYFRVQSRSGEIFLIRYHEFFRAWSILV